MNHPSQRHSWTIVLDDDPTGTQTVRDVPVLTGICSEHDLDWASRDLSRAAFVLTNSRSLDAARAEALTYEIVRRAARVAERRGLRLRTVTRGDSTLRGHFTAEVSAAHRAMRDHGTPAQGTLFVPAFLEAGRITSGDVQWVSTGEGFVPASNTEFAADATFSYGEENLLDWVAARTQPAAVEDPVSVGLELIRSPHGCQLVKRRMTRLGDEQVLVVNAVRPEDLDVVMLGLLDREAEGPGPVIRCGPSFVRQCLGQPPAEPVGHVTGSAGRHGLVVVGSHTALTNAQLNRALASHDLAVVALDAGRVLAGPDEAAAEITRCTEAVDGWLSEIDVVLQTSRVVLTHGRSTPLLTSAAIADALVDIVRRLVPATPLRFLVAKGGNTSSDLATRALEASRAVVRGQMLPGQIPLWELLDGTAPGLPYVVFPGNVGPQNALAEVLTKVKAHG